MLPTADSMSASSREVDDHGRATARQAVRLPDDGLQTFAVSTECPHVCAGTRAGDRECTPDAATRTRHDTHPPIEAHVRDQLALGQQPRLAEISRGGVEFAKREAGSLRDVEQ